MLRPLPLLGLAGVLALFAGCDRGATPPPPAPEGGAAAPADAPADASAGPHAGKTLNVYMWSEYIDPDIVDQFEKLTGATVQIDTYEDSEAMTARMQMQGGAKQYDLLVASDFKVPELVELNLVQPLDLSKVENAGNVMERFRNPPYDPEGRFTLPYQWGTVGLMYRSDRLPEGFEQTWALVFDPSRQPGRVVLIDDMRDCFAAALKYLGESVNATDPAVIRAAGEEILKVKAGENFHAFAPGGSEGPKLVASGAADLAIVYSGDAFKAMSEDEEAPLGYFVPKEGGEVWTDVMLLTAEAQDPDLAHAFVNYILDPQIGAQLANWNSYGTPNQASLQYIDPEQRADPAIYPAEDVLAKMEALKDVGEATAVYDQVWTAIKAR